MSLYMSLKEQLKSWWRPKTELVIFLVFLCSPQHVTASNIIPEGTSVETKSLRSNLLALYSLYLLILPDVRKLNKMSKHIFLITTS